MREEICSPVKARCAINTSTTTAAASSIGTECRQRGAESPNMGIIPKGLWAVYFALSDFFYDLIAAFQFFGSKEVKEMDLSQKGPP